MRRLSSFLILAVLSASVYAGGHSMLILKAPASTAEPPYSDSFTRASGPGVNTGCTGDDECNWDDLHAVPSEGWGIHTNRLRTESDERFSALIFYDGLTTTDNQCCSFRVLVNATTSRSNYCVLRANTAGDDYGHVRAGAWSSGFWRAEELSDPTTFVSGSGDSPDPHGIAAGDYIGVTIEGSTVRFFDFGTSEPDPDPCTWSGAYLSDEDLTLSTTTELGKGGGVGFYSPDFIFGTFDDFKFGDCGDCCDGA